MEEDTFYPAAQDKNESTPEVDFNIPKVNTKSVPHSGTDNDGAIDKRPWLMDWLFEIGHTMAIINHCYEKLQYLKKDLENAGEDQQEADEIVDKTAHYHDIRDIAYEDYDLLMSYVFEAIPESSADARCLVKHAATKLVLAQETHDALTNDTAARNLDLSFKLFAMSVSLAFGIEFSDCMRCIYDGVKHVSEGVREAQKGIIVL